MVLVVILTLFLAVYVYNHFTYRALHSYVSKKEKDANSGVFKGAEPVFLKGSNGRAVLLIHGFIGSPAEFGRLPKLLHEKGFTVSAPLLPGHGTDPRHFSGTKPAELEAFVLGEYTKLKESFSDVTLVGFSMGGALSILTARKVKVDRLVLLAPYIRIAHQWYYIFPVEFYNALFMNFIPYTYRPAHFKQINKKEAIGLIVDYDYLPLKGADTAIKLSNKASKEAAKLELPTLIIHGAQDRATDKRQSLRLVRELKKKNVCLFVALPNTNHMVMLDHDAQAAEEAILGFLAAPANERTSA